MKRTLNILTILFQTGLAFISSFCVYMVFALFDYQGGMENLVGLILFQPLAALLVAGLTIMLCFIVGLPIRLIKLLNIWWRKHFYISLILALIGISLCAVSLTPQYNEVVTYSMDGVDLDTNVPDKFLSITGWFVLVFGLLHLFPPYRLQQKVENLFNKG